MVKLKSGSDSESNVIAHKCVIIYFDGWLFMLILFAWMIICDNFVRIYKYHANLWVINGVLTIKNVFGTNRVVYILPGRGKNFKMVNLRFFN